ACGRRYRPGSPRLVPGPDELLAPPGGEYLRGAERQGAGLLPLVGAERAEEGAGALAHRPGDAEVGEQRLGCESAAVRVEPAVRARDRPRHRRGRRARLRPAAEHRRLGERRPREHATAGGPDLDVEQLLGAPVAEREDLGDALADVLRDAVPAELLVRQRGGVED